MLLGVISCMLYLQQQYFLQMLTEACCGCIGSSKSLNLLCHGSSSSKIADLFRQIPKSPIPNTCTLPCNPSESCHDRNIYIIIIVNRHGFHDSIRLQLSCQRFDSIRYHDASGLYQMYFVIIFIKLYKQITS